MVPRTCQPLRIRDRYLEGDQPREERAVDARQGDRRPSDPSSSTVRLDGTDAFLMGFRAFERGVTEIPKVDRYFTPEDKGLWLAGYDAANDEERKAAARKARR